MIEASKTDERIRLLNKDGIYYVKGNGDTLNVTITTTKEVYERFCYHNRADSIPSWDRLSTALEAIGYGHLYNEKD